MSSSQKKIAIIGSGLIGRSWAIIFSMAGHKVQLYDVNQKALDDALASLRSDITDLCEKKLSRGSLSVDEQIALISTTSSLKECLDGASHVQECIFENLPLKQDLFEEIDNLVTDTDCSLASSTSIHLPSLVFSKVKKHQNQCLVAHPINPPLHVLLVELVPHPTTKPELLSKTRELFENIGQKPVILRKEVSGFALNRLQYAVIQEAYRLVADGVMSTEDVDTVVTDGLGPRYAFIGPWLTCHLNATGMQDYIERYAEGIYNVGIECTPYHKLEGNTAKQIVDDITKAVPLEQLPLERKWRDQCLIELSKVKKTLSKNQ